MIIDKASIQALRSSRLLWYASWAENVKLGDSEGLQIMVRLQTD